MIEEAHTMIVLFFPLNICKGSRNSFISICFSLPHFGFTLRSTLPRPRFSRTLGLMEVQFTPEQEAQLAQIATTAGTDPQRLGKDAVLRLIQPGSTIRPPVPELPVWDLGAIGSLRRRDLYDDAR